MIKFLILASCLITLLSCSSNEEDKDKDTAYHFVQENEKEHVLDSLLYSDRFVKDTVLLELFWQGNYNKILDYKDSLLSKRGKDIFVIALAKENMELLEKNIGKLLPEVLILNVIKGNESFEDLYEDKKFLKPIPLFKKYAIYLYVSENYSVPIGFIGNFMTWFNHENLNNDPIIHNEYLFILSKLSEEKEPTGYIADYLEYTDSLMQVFPENDHLKNLLAYILIDLEEFDEAIQIYKNTFRKTRNIDFLFGIAVFYQNIQPNKDSLDKYVKILEAHPDYKEP